MAELKLFGHSLIEGVCISGPKGRAAAVRNEDGDIVYRIKKEPRAAGGFARLLRGARELWQGLVWSARQVGDTGDDNLGVLPVIGSVLGSLILALLVFIFIPVTAAAFAERFLPGPLCSLIEGLLRAAFLALFLVRLSRFNDIKRLKGYNAAAHQAMAAYEANAELSPDSLSRFPLRSRRDGLAVALTAVFFLIIIFAFLNRLDALPRILIKLALLLLAALLGQAVWSRGCRRPEDGLAKILLAPTVPAQKLLTRRPDPSQQEVAIAALLAVPEIGSVRVDASRRHSLAPTPGSNRAALSSAAAAAAYMEALRRSGTARPATADQLAAYAAAKAAAVQPQAETAGQPQAETAGQPVEQPAVEAAAPAEAAADETIISPLQEPAAEAAAAAAVAAAQPPAKGKSKRKNKKRFGFLNKHDNKPAEPPQPAPAAAPDAPAAGAAQEAEEAPRTSAAHLMDEALADLMEGREAEAPAVETADAAPPLDVAEAAEKAVSEMEEAAAAAAGIAAAVAAAEKDEEQAAAAAAAAEAGAEIEDIEIENDAARQAADESEALSGEAEEAAADREAAAVSGTDPAPEGSGSKLGRKTAALAGAAAAAIISGSRELGQSANRLADAVTRGIKPGHKEPSEEPAAEPPEDTAAGEAIAAAPEAAASETAAELAAAAAAEELSPADAELAEIEAKAAAQAEALAKAQAQAEAEAEEARAAARAEAAARRKARSEAEARAAAKARAKEEEKAREAAEAAAREEEQAREAAEAAEAAARAEAEKLRRADAEALARTQAEAEEPLFREPEAPAPDTAQDATQDAAAVPPRPARPPKKGPQARGYRNDKGRYVERRPRPSQESANRMQRLARNIGLKVDRIYGDVEYYDPEDADKE